MLCLKLGKKQGDNKTGTKWWPIIAQDGTIIAEGDSEYYKKALARQLSVQNIGNLTILSQQKNSESDTKSFDQKKEIYKDFAAYIRLTIVNDIIYDINGVERPKWDVEEIEIREKDLVKLFYKMWPSPNDLR